MLIAELPKDDLSGEYIQGISGREDDCADKAQKLTSTSTDGYPYWEAAIMDKIPKRLA